MARDRDVVVAEPDDRYAGANQVHDSRDPFGGAPRIEFRGLAKLGEPKLGRDEFVDVIARPRPERLVVPDSREEPAQRGTVEVDHAIQRTGEKSNGPRSTLRTRCDLAPT